MLDPGATCIADRSASRASIRIAGSGHFELPLWLNSGPSALGYTQRISARIMRRTLVRPRPEENHEWRMMIARG
jgi:hypothetical protein